jgi:uncharacterized protein
MRPVSSSSTGGAAAGTAFGVAAAVGAAALAWGVLVERNRFTIRHEFLPVLEAGAKQLTVLHFSDLHLAPWQQAKMNWIRSLVRLEPDLIINTGDNLGHGDAYEAIEHTFAPFAGIPGVWVNGSNDYYGPTAKNPLRYFSSPSNAPRTVTRLDTERLERYFGDGLGWSNLNNAATSMTIADTAFEFFGVNDAHRGWDKLDVAFGALDDVREDASWLESKATPVSIGVTHAPYQRVLDSFVTNGADVIFAGHTHGGQVRIPGLPALVTNCDIPREKASGLSTWTHARRTAFLNVSAGLGTSIYAPVRFACPPEAVLVTLTAGDIGYS